MVQCTLLPYLCETKKAGECSEIVSGLSSQARLKPYHIHKGTFWNYVCLNWWENQIKEIMVHSAKVIFTQKSCDIFTYSYWKGAGTFCIQLGFHLEGHFIYFVTHSFGSGWFTGIFSCTNQCTLWLYITPFTLANGLVYLEIVWELLRKLWNKSDIIQLVKVLLGNWAHTNWIGNRIHMKQAFHNIGLSRNTNASLICCEVSSV